MPRVTATAWTLKAYELLADGEWHDGLAICREVEKQIIPGVALRTTESLRLRKRLARDPEAEDTDRVKERREATLIAMGKREITRRMVNGRLAAGSWETDPSPLPEAGWREGGWQLRDVTVLQASPRELSRQLRAEPQTLRKLILQEPALRHRVAGKVLYLWKSELPLLEERLVAFRAEAGVRRGARSRAAHEARRNAVKTHISLTEASERLGVSFSAVRSTVDELPDFPLIRRGSITYMPVDQVENLRRLVQEWAARSPRRRASVRPVAPPPPTFDDAELTDTYGRYLSGETELREEVYAGMRRAFHEAPEV